MTYTQHCEQCGDPIIIQAGAYRVVAIRHGGKAASYGRAAVRTYQNIYVHTACLDAWHVAQAAGQQQVTGVSANG